MAQEQAAAGPPRDATADEIRHGSEVGGLHLPQETQLTFLVLVFAFVALGFLFLITRGRPATPFLLRIYTITIIVFGSLILVSASYSNSQMAAVIGLFGTIAGYVLGRTERNNDQPSEPAAPPPPSPPPTV